VASRLRVKRPASATQLRRGAVLALALATATGAALYAGASGAGAAAAPTIGQVQAKINGLQAQMDKLDQQYDAAGQQLSAAQSRLGQVEKETVTAQARYAAARSQLAQVAVSLYENSDQTSILGLLNAGNPSAVLSQASLVMEVAGAHNEEATQFLAAAQELASIRDQRQRTELGIAQIHAQLTAEKASLGKLLQTSQATLDSLTAQQQAKVNQGTVGGGQTGTGQSGGGQSGGGQSGGGQSGGGQSGGGQSGGGQTGTPPIKYTGPTTTQADKAVAFAYAQIGKPYEWGATGPNSYDCSGLVMAAWAYAGVTIPRDTYEQWAGLPHIPVSQMVPGDLIIYDGEGHVGMYVGGGYIIDAPHTGADVERIPYSTPWYLDSMDGVLQP
jgi:cell wall-associated NlpC family hydrolase